MAKFAGVIMWAIPALASACASSPPRSPAATSPAPLESGPARTDPAHAASAPSEMGVEQLTWLEGRWEHQGGTEHWVRAGTHLWGVGFTVKGNTTVFFEVLTVENPGGGVRYVAMPDGKTEVAFSLIEASGSAVTFANPEHDSPKVIRYQRQGDLLTAQTEGGGPAQSYQWRRGAPGKAEALEAADIAFAADVARRGVDGWVAAFAPDGAMWSRGARTRRDRDAIRKAMAPLFEKGTTIEWAPVASALSPAGDVGYTIGTSRFTEPGKNGERVETHRGSYVTIWRRQTDGSWKVLFDTGN